MFGAEMAVETLYGEALAHLRLRLLLQALRLAHQSPHPVAALCKSQVMPANVQGGRRLSNYVVNRKIPLLPCGT